MQPPIVLYSSRPFKWFKEVTIWTFLIFKPWFKVVGHIGTTIPKSENVLGSLGNASIWLSHTSTSCASAFFTFLYHIEFQSLVWPNPIKKHLVSFHVWKKYVLLLFLGVGCAPKLGSWHLLFSHETHNWFFFSSFMSRFERGWMPHCLQPIHYTQFTLTISYERKGMDRWKFFNLQINIMMSNFSSTLSIRMHIHCKVFKSL